MTQLSSLLSEVIRTQDEQRRNFDARVPAVRARLLERYGKEKRHQRFAFVAVATSVAAAAAAAIVFFVNSTAPAVSYEAKSESLSAESVLERSPPAVLHLGDEKPSSAAEESSVALPPNRVVPTLAPVSSRNSVGKESVQDWKSLARAGKYEAAITDAKLKGIESLVASLEVDDLLLLSEAARFAGDTGTTLGALQAIRTRFPQHPQSAVATFSLGRLQADALGDPAAAAGYFEDYLTEQPWGPLASVARGRLIEVRRKMGDKVGAEQAARTYLQHHAQGPHAELARRVIASVSNP